MTSMTITEGPAPNAPPPQTLIDTRPAVQEGRP